jgi:hypothetical protein
MPTGTPSETVARDACFKGVTKAFPVEEEAYYWNLSRYIHLNPCHASKPLAETPETYRHSSSYGG